MIHVEDLKKYYGATKALDGISFDVPKGQVLGFLGPNGAGKTTTMKILTGFLYPDSGIATIGDIDVINDPLRARKLVGYLPETNPLYTEMNVYSYLKFVADARGISREDRKKQIDKVVQECGLQAVIGRDIKELSKGYRQRVGLAQAMIHDPEVLILDEPTSGLDPNQIIEIRELIKKIGEQRTVILSTHYLQEVEAACNRVIIVHKGKIVADGNIEELTKKESPGFIELGIIGPHDSIISQLHEFAGEENVEYKGQVDGANYYIIKKLPEGMGNEALFDLVVTRNGWKIVELYREAPRLEAVFRRLTGGKEEPVPGEAVVN